MNQGQWHINHLVNYFLALTICHASHLRVRTLFGAHVDVHNIELSICFRFFKYSKFLIVRRVLDAGSMEVTRASLGTLHVTTYFRKQSNFFDSDF